MFMHVDAAVCSLTDAADTSGPESRTLFRSRGSHSASTRLIATPTRFVPMRTSGVWSALIAVSICDGLGLGLSLDDLA